MHGHYLNPWGMSNTVVVWRDGRDVMVSLYHHCLFEFSEGERENAHLVKRARDEVGFKDYENVAENLPEFIEYAFTRLCYPRFTWADFARRWHGRESCIHARYEEILADAPGQLCRIAEELTGTPLALDEARRIDGELSFARQSGRQPGQECKTSFMRKGIAGDWRNCFNRAACEIFDRHAGDELVLLGYEKDRAWIDGAMDTAARVRVRD